MRPSGEILNQRLLDSTRESSPPGADGYPRLIWNKRPALIRSSPLMKLELEYELDCELDLALRNRRPGEQPCHSGRCTVREKNVGVVRGCGRREVGVVQDVEDLGPELYVEILRDTPDVIVLKDGQVQTSDAWADQNIPTRIAAEIEALQVGQIPALTIVGREKCGIRRRWNRKALRLDVI